MRGDGATTLKPKKNDGYSRVPLDTFVVWSSFVIMA